MMRRDRASAPSSRSSSSRSSSASPIRLVMTGFAQVAFKDKANGSLITRNGKVVGSRLAAQEFTSRSTSTSGRRRPRPPTTRPRTTFANLGPDQSRAGQERAAAAAGDPEARGAVQPRPDDRRHPRRRGDDLGLGDRPAHLAGLRASSSPGGSQPSAASRSTTVAGADRPEHRRPLARLLRRARRQRPQAQSRTRQGAEHVMARASASVFSTRHRPRGDQATRSPSSTRGSRSGIR